MYWLKLLYVNKHAHIIVSELPLADKKKIDNKISELKEYNYPKNDKVRMVVDFIEDNITISRLKNIPIKRKRKILSIVVNLLYKQINE